MRSPFTPFRFISGSLTIVAIAVILRIAFPIEVASAAPTERQRAYRGEQFTTYPTGAMTGMTFGDAIYSVPDEVWLTSRSVVRISMKPGADVRGRGYGATVHNTFPVRVWRVRGLAYCSIGTFWVSAEPESTSEFEFPSSAFAIGDFIMYECRDAYMISHSMYAKSGLEPFVSWRMWSELNVDNPAPTTRSLSPDYYPSCD